MRDFRIGAPKAEELRAALVAEQVAALAERTDDEPATDPWDLAEPSGSGPSPFSTADPAELMGGTPLSAPPSTVPPTAPIPFAPRVSAPIDLPAAETKPTTVSEPAAQVAVDGHPGTPAEPKPVKPLVVWPVWLLMLPAFVAVWAGWVELGKLTGFGPVDLLPGFTRDGRPLVTLDTAITLPIGMETYAAYALYVWLSGRTSNKTRRFAMASALIALSLGAGAQITYHLIATPTTGAPWQITTVVACLPVVVLGIGAALGHLVREDAKR
jgi:hypothetical protein